MRDPKVPRQSPPTSSVPAAPGSHGSAWDPASDHERAIAQAPGTVAPRRRRRWPVVPLVAVIVVAGVTAGLVVWAPWTQPPVLRPAGLAAGPSTANSIAFRWARPATGPLPDKYLILSDGRAAGSVAGTATSYRQAGPTPASPPPYRVVAGGGGRGATRTAPPPRERPAPPTSP